MSIPEIISLILVGFAAFAAVGILITRNVIHAAFYLVMCLVSIAGIYVLLNAMFLAVVQLLVYAGGVLILLAFGIMLTNRPDASGKLISGHHLPLSGLIAGVGIFLLLAVVITRFVSPVGMIPSNPSQVQVIGEGFMTDYILVFELIAYLLLVVLVGAGYYAKKSQEI